MDQQSKHPMQGGLPRDAEAAATGRPEAADGRVGMEAQRPAGTVLPVIEERLVVGRRVHETGGAVRVRKVVEQREVTVDEPLWRERIEIERVPVGRVVEAAPPTRYEGDVTIVPIVEEVLVVERRLMLKEEVRIARHRERHVEPRSVTLRTERAVVERRDSPDGPWYPLDEASGQAAQSQAAPPLVPDDGLRGR